MSLFGGDDQNACATNLERTTGESKATGTIQSNWRSYFSDEGQWTLYESTLGTLQSYSLLQWQKMCSELSLHHSYRTLEQAVRL